MEDLKEMLEDPHFGPLLRKCWEVYKSKGRDYTQGTGNRVLNFLEAGKYAGISPLQAWMVYSYKQYSAVASYIKGVGESEPIENRIIDNINYLVLLYALIEYLKDQSV